MREDGQVLKSNGPAIRTRFDGPIRHTSDMTGIIQTLRFSRGDGHPKGSAWLVPDQDQLAIGIAQIALGQWRHLERILQGNSSSLPAHDYAIRGAIKTLSAPPGSPDWQVWHRDGWLFQAISWIAAVETNRGPTQPPHIRPADKGFDSLQLLLSRDGTKVKRLIIGEDKATVNPRDMIRDNVWPELTMMESGDRDHELRSALASLLFHAPQIDELQAVNRVMRNVKHRSYRIAVTAGPRDSDAPGIRRLFKGYDAVVGGARFRRRAHVLTLDDTRQWMAEIADSAISIIEGSSDV